MSSISENTALMAILSELKTLNGRISSLESSKPSAPAAGGKAKKARKSSAPTSAEGKPKREPSSWLLFTGRVRELLRTEGYAAAALGKECQMFASSLKEENADFSSWSDSDILARRAAWAAPEVSKQKAAGKSWRKTPTGSVVSGEAPEEAEEEAEKPKKARKNPWEGLSDEQKAERIAKMKAGKAAKKAAAEGSAPEAEEEAPVSPKVKAEAAPKVKAEAAPKVKAEAAPKVKAEAAKPSSPKAAPKSTPAAPVAAAPVVAAPAASAAGQFKPVLLVGVRYLVNMESGHAYYRNEDGSQGDWAGIFSRTPKPHVDTSVPEPGAEGEEEELNFDE